MNTEPEQKSAPQSETPETPERSAPPQTPAPQPASAEDAPAGKRRRAGCLGTFLMSVGALVMLVFLLSFALILIAIFTGPGEKISEIRQMRPRKFEEKIVQYRPDVEEKIVIIDIKGMISFGASGKGGNADQLKNQVSQAAQDPKTAAVILEINSPGGEITAVDEVHHSLRRLRDNDIPVIAVMRSMGASGAYYIAAGADHIIANPMTLTGSIGVMIPYIEYNELLEKIGVSYTPYTSGELKDLLSGAREREEDEQRKIDSHLKEIIDQSYHRFAQTIADGREEFSDADSVKEAKFKDGRILSGTQAMEQGLVDELGHLENGIEKALELAAIEEANIVRYRRPWTFRDLPFLGESEDISLIKIDGGEILQSGQALYYLLPGLSQR